MNEYRQIPCTRHDFLELACIRRYPLVIELKNEGTIHGRAITTETRADKSEWLHIETTTTKRSIRLDHIIAITPDIDGAEFSRIVISP